MTLRNWLIVSTIFSLKSFKSISAFFRLKTWESVTTKAFVWVKFNPVTSLEVKYTCREISKSTSNNDMAPTNILKAMICSYPECFASLINSILLKGTFPTSPKESIVRPLHKKGDVNEMKNYRPVTNLKSVTKLAEKIILKQQMSHLNIKPFAACLSIGIPQRLFNGVWSSSLY